MSALRTQKRSGGPGRFLSYKKYQNGFVVTALTAIVSAVALFIVIGSSTSFMLKKQADEKLSQQEYLEDFQKYARDWYELNAQNIDSNLFASDFSAERFLVESGFQLRYGAEVALSRRIESGVLRYRNIVVWLPTDEDSTNPPLFDLDTGDFQPCSEAPCKERAFAVFSGKEVQARLLQRAQFQLDEIALKSQQYFKSRMISDSERDLTKNHFRPEGFFSESPKFPVLTGFTPVAGSSNLNLSEPVAGSVLDALSMGMAFSRNPWGVPIEVNNSSPEAENNTPPYTVLYRSITPWGQTLTRFAVQPL